MRDWTSVEVTCMNPHVNRDISTQMQLFSFGSICFLKIKN